MTCSATKIRTGCYQYRGYEIESLGGHWNIKEIGEWDWADARNTLSESKEAINTWLGE